MFQHFLITRFNLRQPDWTTTKSHSRVLDDAWLDHRFALFERFCLPSVAAQHCGDFRWLVYFDTDTSEAWRARIARCREHCPQLEPVFVEGMAAFLPDVQQRLAASTEDWVMSSRLDNDDCLHPGHIALLQQAFQAQPYLLLDVVDGYTLEIQPRHRLGRALDPCNPFVTLIERNQAPRSVWHRSHGSWKREPRVQRIRGQRSWLSVIHAQNKTNEFQGYGDVAAAEVADFFPDPAVQSEVLAGLEPVARWRWRSLANRVQSRLGLAGLLLKRRLGIYG